MGQITATRNLVAIKVVRHAGQSITTPWFLISLAYRTWSLKTMTEKKMHEWTLPWRPDLKRLEKTTLVQVVAWCHQAPSRYLSQCWSRSMLPYGVSDLSSAQQNCIHVHFQLFTTHSSVVTESWTYHVSVMNLSHIIATGSVTYLSHTLPTTESWTYHVSVMNLSHTIATAVSHTCHIPYQQQCHEPIMSVSWTYHIL